MKLPLISLLLIALLSSLGTVPVNAKERPRPDPGAEVMLLVASTVGLSRDELNRAFKVISDFQSRKFTLSELDSLSDDDVLAKINFATEPYASLDSQQLMLVAKRYEIETELLADRAGVDVEKFRQFYRTFDRTLTLALRLNRYVSAKQNTISSTDSSLSYFDEDDFDGPLIDCDRSCEAVQEKVWDDFIDQLNIVGDMQDWENQQNDEQPIGTVARIVDSESGNFIEVRKQFSTVSWVPLTGGSDCGAAACI
ncbi:hypothetical protein [Pseudidiomarina terrestris]|uniref:Uncharacterized protein n=1 Tax=Pseudidiomarina terrestris TaxID=2820060 RepID=A0AAW7R1H6_9GAMM|nr:MULTISPECIES: hypothetical protein [unclassified Pseudidiomarina]MDN7125607.1 hypothetical protein [Pseudidiomarina sp. 1APP75-32.1]MDN7126143.1 hypothetical protein [Pseudidiomarina sp. 1APR75-33.1]MDN7130529.1 hypothetical protein [Pseudidiomarina sp. 1APR75-15]MDN7134171.1 hypothetical protein [Pseudidiomarina sp. 1ASP75-5]MDN7137142.1 hypothetical protein [Pseudidiomarina sp. 1ASP75-14]